MKITVISLAFRPGFIDTVVDALIHQSLPQDDWELIIVDDSYQTRKDAVFEYLDGKVKNWAYIPPFHIEDGVAPAQAINAGLALAKGELVFFSSDRFYAHPQCLEKHWDIYSRYGPNVIISGPFMDAKLEYRDYEEFTEENKISILKNPIGVGPLLTKWTEPEVFKQVWKKYVHEWREHSCTTIQLEEGLFENRNNAGHENPGCWWWCGINDSAPLHLLLSVNGLDESFNGIRGGVDSDLGSRLYAYGCRYLFQMTYPVVRFPGTIRKPDLLSEEERALNVARKRGGERTIFAPNDYDLSSVGVNKLILPDTDIITIHAGPTAFLKKCLDNIEENTVLPYRNVIVADGPDEEGVEYINSLGNAKVKINPELIGIEPAMNQAFEMANAKYVCSINTDIEIRKGTVEAMREVLDRYPKMGWVALSSEYTGFLPACSMFTREALDKVGPLDEGFSGYGFGDDDLLRRMWGAGYKPHIVSGVRISHKHGGATAKTIHGKEESAKKFLQAQQIFYEKYGENGTNWDDVARYNPHSDTNNIVEVNTHRIDWIRSNIKPDQKVLEVGCAENPVFAGTDFKVTTVDKSSRPDENCFPDFEANAENLLWEARYFDIVNLGELLEHVEDPQVVLSEAIRVARNKVIVTVPFEHLWTEELKPFWNPGHVRFYDIRTFREELAMAGLPYQVDIIKNGDWAWLGGQIYCDGRGMMTEQERVIKLNIGSFTVMMPPPEWVNLDIIDLKQYAQEKGFKFRQVDITQGIPYESGSVDLINASHIIEHLTVEQGIAFLKECWRVLKPGSTIRVGTPDLDTLIFTYQNEDMDSFNDIQPDEYKQSPSQADKFWRLLTAGHKTCYDKDALFDVIQEAGFEDINVSEYHPELDKFPEVSLYVEAAKPSSAIEELQPQVPAKEEEVPEYWRKFAEGK